jgi:hypothetical protein
MLSVSTETTKLKQEHVGPLGIDPYRLCLLEYIPGALLFFKALYASMS